MAVVTLMMAVTAMVAVLVAILVGVFGVEHYRNYPASAPSLESEALERGFASAETVLVPVFVTHPEARKIAKAIVDNAVDFAGGAAIAPVIVTIVIGPSVPVVLAPVALRAALIAAKRGRNP